MSILQIVATLVVGIVILIFGLSKNKWLALISAIPFVIVAFNVAIILSKQ